MRRIQRFIGILFMIPLLLPVFSGCGNRERALHPVRVAFSFGAVWLDVYQAMEDMFLTAVKESGANIEVQFWYADGELEREASNIRKAISSEPDILVLMPLNSVEILHYIEAAHSRGIPVVVYNRQQEPHETIKPEAYVGLDTYDQAYTTGIGLFKLMHQENLPSRTAVILGDLSDRNAVNRRTAFRRAADEMGAEIVTEIESFWDAKTAASGLEKALEAYPEINSLLISSDFMMEEVRKVLIRNNRWFPQGEKGHVFIGSQDTFSIAVPFIKSGYIDVDTAFDIWPMSKTLVQVINTLASGKIPGQEAFLVPGRVVNTVNISQIDDLWSLKE